MDDGAFNFAAQPAQGARADGDAARVGADIDAELSTFVSQFALGGEGPESFYNARCAVQQ